MNCRELPFARWHIGVLVLRWVDTYEMRFSMAASKGCPRKDFRYFSRSGAWAAVAEGILAQRDESVAYY